MMNVEVSAHGMGSYYREELLEEIIYHVESELHFIDDLKVGRIFLVGSRINGKYRNSSDLDVVFEYEGGIKEWRLSDVLNDKLEIDGVRIDFLGTKGSFEGAVGDRSFIQLQ